MNNIELEKMIIDANKTISTSNDKSKYIFEMISDNEVDLVEYLYEGMQRNLAIKFYNGQIILDMQHLKFMFWGQSMIGSFLSETISKIALCQIEYIRKNNIKHRYYNACSVSPWNINKK